MDASHNDLEAIRRLLADLTARVNSIERRLDVEGELASSRASTESAPITNVTAPPFVSADITATDTRQQPVAPVPIVPTVSSRHVSSQVASSQTGSSQPRPLSANNFDLESRIGSHWLNRIGIAALLIGTAYFLKWRSTTIGLAPPVE